MERIGTPVKGEAFQMEREPTEDEVRRAVAAEDDERLVAWLLDRTADLSVREARAQTGLSTGALTRYRAGDFEKLQPATRRQIAVFLGQTVPRGTAERPPPEVRAAAYDLIAELVALTSGVEVPAEPGAASAAERAVRAKILRSLLDRSG